MTSTALHPRITVVSPCYNDGATIEETVDSICEGEAVDVLIVDDGSTDARTIEVLAQLEQRPDVRVVRHPQNRGIPAGINTGLTEARTPYVFLVGSDDTIAPGALAALADGLDGHPDAVAAWGHYEFFGDWVGTRNVPPWDPWRLMHNNYWPGVVLVRREAILELGGFSERSRYEDWDMWMTVAEAGRVGIVVDHAMFRYRIQSKSVRRSATAKDRFPAEYREMMLGHPKLFARKHELAARSGLSPAERARERLLLRAKLALPRPARRTVYGVAAWLETRRHAVSRALSAEHRAAQRAAQSGPAHRIVIVSALVEPSIGGVEHYVRWARSAMPAKGIAVTVVSSAGGPNSTNPGADHVVPTWWLRGYIPMALPAVTTFRTLWRSFREADAVLVQNLTHPICLYAAVIARILGVPARTMIHEADVPRFNRRSLRLLKRAYDLTGARLTLALAPPTTPSQTCGAFLQQKFDRPVAVIPYPIGELPEIVSAPSLADQEPFTAVFTARYAPEKRPLDVIALGARVPDMQVRMWGEGELASACRLAAAKLPNVECNNGIPWEDVLKAYASAHLVVSASSHDTTQLALLEPMIMGVPAIATAVGEAPTYFPGELSRFVCEPGDLDAMVRAVAELRSDYDRWRGLFADNAVRLRAAHDPESIIERTLLTCGIVTSAPSAGAPEASALVH